MHKTVFWTAVLAMAMTLFPSWSQAGADKAYSLDFDASRYTERTLTVDGATVRCRAYEGIVYVAHPVDVHYQSMNIYVPAAYFEGKTINSYTADTAPIFFPNMVGGYMPGEPGSPDKEFRGPRANSISAALAHGYVVAAPGARGRTTQAADGRYTGKAPACIVDLKAAVRYLRRNDAAMPGDAEKIVSNGTSAGGALSALLGGTGNNGDYAPYLEALGAAAERDDIFAASCYCPITNLDHADMAYEWQFNGVDTYKQMVFGKMTDWHEERKTRTGQLDAGQISVSAMLKASFPAYVNGLGLMDPSGKALTLDDAGNGSFKDYVAAQVAASAQNALDGGADLSGFGWLTVRDGKVVSIDFTKYVHYMERMKTPPAFDALDLSSGENSLFGSETVDTRHFTGFGLEHDTAGGKIADAALVKMMNPMEYIRLHTSTVAKYWRIRHGTMDKDTSLGIPTILATTLRNNGYQVDFALPWERPHSGDYDLDRLFAWIDGVCAK